MDTMKFSARDIVDVLQADRPADQRLYPTEEQLGIIEYPLQPLLVVAGAGSGKTHTMTDRVIWLIANGYVKPEEVLGVTFTRKAAGELQARINTAIETLAQQEIIDLDPTDPGHATVLTYHSYASSLVTDHGLRIGVETESRLLGDAQAYQVLADVVNNYQGSVDISGLNKTSLIQAVRQLASDSAEHLVEPAEIIAHMAHLQSTMDSLPLKRAGNDATRKIAKMIPWRQAMAELVEDYQHYKTTHELMDFGDLVRYAHQIATSLPEVVQIERERYKIVLLDEFQDTSHAQLELFTALFGGQDSHAVTAVGDPNQSIYGFRGASAGQLGKFVHAFPHRTADGDLAPAPTAELTVAWRNGSTILDMANVITATMEQQLKVSQLRPRPKAPTGQVTVNWFATSDEEATTMAKLLRDELRLDTDQPSERTAAVLCRRKVSFERVMKAFDDHGVPYELVGLSGLLETPEVIQVLAVLEVIADSNASDALFRILVSPRWRLGTADLWTLKSLARSIHKPTGSTEDLENASLIEALHQLPKPDWKIGEHSFSAEGHARLRQLAAELETLSQQMNRELPHLLREIISTIGVGHELAAHPGIPVEHSQRNLEALVATAEQYVADQATTGTDLSGYIAWLKTAAEEEDGLELPASDPVPGAVQILTMHASKGLEWDVVLIPDMQEDNFPSSQVDLWTRETTGALPWPLRGDRHSLPQWNAQAAETREQWAAEALGSASASQVEKQGWGNYRAEVAAHQLDEERRLAYVGYTRAKDWLWLSGSAWVRDTGTKREPSTFLQAVYEQVDSGADAGPNVGHWETEFPEHNPNGTLHQQAEWPFDPLNGPQITSRAADGEIHVHHRSYSRRDNLQRAAEQVSTAGEIEDAQLADQITWMLARRGLEQSTTVELPKHLSTTGFISLATEPETVARRLRRPMPQRPVPAARTGTLVHEWIEDHFGRTRPGVTGMLDIENLDYSADDDWDHDTGVAQLKQNFLDSEWAQKSPALIEAEIETTVAGVTLRGRIDAVFRTGGDPDVEFDPEARWELVDWKTGRVPGEKELETLGLQLAVYRLAWSRLHGIPMENITGRFVYLAHGVEKTPHHLATEEELVEILREATGVR